MFDRFFLLPGEVHTFVPGSFDSALVTLSLGVAIALSWVALHTADIAATLTSRLYYHLATAMASLALGGGIWAMHFIGMMAFHLPAPMHYTLGLTVASIMPGIAASWLALHVLARPRVSRIQLATSGLLVGAGIGLMHYAGMMAMVTPLEMRYVPSLFLLSIVVAVVLAMLALWIHAGLKQTRMPPIAQFLLAGIVMGAAITTMHYTGMSAARFFGTSAHAGTQNGDQALFVSLALALSSIIFGLLVAAVNALIRSREFLRQATLILERMGTGHLDTPVPTLGHHEMARLFSALRNTQTHLAHIVFATRTSAESIHANVRSVTDESADLQTRTQARTADLQQTAASMEQLSSTIQISADHTAEVESSMATAHEATEQGEALMRQAMAAMRAIQSVGSEVTTITGVLDDIAFQTNLLSLNASVEAARAGEQGSGFAVVAGEVRNLAQRSHQSARSIKQLIDDSTARIDEGVTQVERSEQQLNVIASAIDTAHRFADEIAQASREQAAGIEQVNQATASMDTSIQHDTLLVSQMVSASDALTRDADALLSTVNQFHTSVSATSTLVDHIETHRSLADTLAESGGNLRAVPWYNTPASA